MHAHRDAATQRGEGVIVVDAQLIAGMANLVNGGIEAVERIGLDHPRGDAAVLPAAAAEGMHRQIQTAPRPVIAEGGGAGACQSQLGFLREMAGQRGGLVLGAKDVFAQRHQPRPHRIEQRGDPRAGHAGLVIVQQRVIEIAAIGQRGGLFAFQHQHLIQHRQEIIRRVGGAGIGPDRLRQRCQPRQFRGQTRRNPAGAAIVAGDQLDGAGIGLAAGLDAGQPFAQTRIGAAFVQQRLDRGHFLGPLFDGTARHHRFLIPAQPFGNR